MRAAPEGPGWTASALIWCALIGACFVVHHFVPRAAAVGAIHKAQAALLNSASGRYGGDARDYVTDAGVRIESADPQKSVGLHMPFALAAPLDAPPPGPWLLLTGEARAQIVQAGAPKWEAARIFIARYGPPIEKRYGEVSYAAAFKRSSGWRRVRAHAPLLQEGQEGFIGVELQKTSGLLEARDLRLSFAKPHPARGLAVALLLGGWAAAFAGLALRLLEGMSTAKGRAALLGVGGAATILTLLPGEARKIWVDGFVSAVNTAGGGAFALAPSLVDQLVHFGLFAGLVVAASRLWRQVPVIPLAFGALLFAAGTETLQLFAPGRLADWGDFLTNLAGLGAGATGALALRAAGLLARPPRLAAPPRQLVVGAD